MFLREVRRTFQSLFFYLDLFHIFLCVFILFVICRRSEFKLSLWPDRSFSSELNGTEGNQNHRQRTSDIHSPEHNFLNSPLKSDLRKKSDTKTSQNFNIFKPLKSDFELPLSSSTAVTSVTSLWRHCDVTAAVVTWWSAPGRDYLCEPHEGARGATHSTWQDSVWTGSQFMNKE